MKKIIIALLAVIIVLSLVSCEAKEQEYSYSIKDALKISTWVLDESIDENGYWVNEAVIGRRSGYWVDENTGQIFDDDEKNVFVLEQLSLNEVKMMAPFNYISEDTALTNLNISCEFDGMIEVESEDEYILLGCSDKNPAEPWQGGGSTSSVKVAYKVCFDICPLESYPSDTHNIRNDIKKTDREYYLNVNAYKFDNEETPVIRAKLRLVVLEDKGLLHHHDSLGSYVGEEMSRFMSIELVSYEYSDIYKILDEIVDEEDEWVR